MRFGRVIGMYWGCLQETLIASVFQSRRPEFCSLCIPLTIFDRNVSSLGTIAVLLNIFSRCPESCDSLPLSSAGYQPAELGGIQGAGAGPGSAAIRRRPTGLKYQASYEDSSSPPVQRTLTLASDLLHIYFVYGKTDATLQPWTPCFCLYCCRATLSLVAAIAVRRRRGRWEN